MRKLSVCLILLTIVLLMCGCSAQYDYSPSRDYWKSEPIAQQGVSILCDRLATNGTLGTHPAYSGEAVTLEQNQHIEYSVTLSQGGLYNLEADFYILHNGLSDSEISVTVNGSTALSRAPLKALWTAEEGEFDTDSFGNDIVPTQTKANIWQSERLYSYDYLTALPYVFSLNEGENLIRIELISGGSTAIGALRVISRQSLISYETYMSNYGNAAKGEQSILLQAERPTYKNDSSVIATYSADVNVTPYDTYVSRLNTLSGWGAPDQKVIYTADVEQGGLYCIGLNYLVDNPNRTTYITLEVDGEVPFGELLHYPLQPNDSFDLHTMGGDKPYYIYLSEGRHTLSIRIDGSLVAEELEQLSDIILSLNDTYLDLKKIAGAADDANREWNPTTDFPGVVESLESIGDSIAQISKSLIAVNCTGANYQAIIYLEAAQKAIDGLLEKPMYIPNNYARLSEGSGSIAQTLVNAQSDVTATPLSIDFVAVMGENKPDIPNHGGFFRFWEGVKKFFHSFTADYSVTTDDEKTIQVWVARSRQYVDLMQQMVDDSDFFAETGYKVKFSLLADEGKLILSNAAGIEPNAVMGISNWLPYEMGIRGLTCDLSQFEDYPDVIGRFSEGALIPLIADGRALGLPETQDFYVMYYRKDILQKYNIPLPDTWNEVLAILPELQRYGLNFYIPLSSSTSSKSIMTTAPFIYQYGGTLFSDDAKTTTIDEENSLDAIKLMTELYTLYGLPQQVNNFFDSFRNGSLPIGISTFDTFVKLSFAAPEISGMWGMALTPGVENQSTSIVERWQTGSSSSVVLFDSGDDQTDRVGWELLKWWTSEQVQSEFANRLIMLYGKAYIWNSANLSAFNLSASFTPQQRATILAQWEWMREIPRVPGWYMLERELSNAWNSIVINGENTRVVVEDAVTRINKELKRKLTEFGYLSGNETVKPYTITTIEYIRRIKYPEP